MKDVVLLIHHDCVNTMLLYQLLNTEFIVDTKGPPMVFPGNIFQHILDIGHFLKMGSR